MRRAHLATVSGSPVDPTKGHLVSMLRTIQVERVYSPLLSETYETLNGTCGVTSFRTLPVRPATRPFVRCPLLSRRRL
ncbi:hypothetical protein PUN28_014991 [Cardiocondyla obscurior]|uniref:Uncharacterized protein n=1 Tax=Cardiocondyla obscurior TaxID=286306 RepID=A0AAW2EZI8_9HYME